MPIDLEKVKKRLASLNSNTSQKDNIWKPSEGENIIRILPNRFTPDMPFVELFFHYGINKKTYLSPSSHGRPDPIIKFAEGLKKTGDKEDWKNGNKLMPKSRNYALILARGKDKQKDEGPKFWAFGKQVLESLLNILADPDYGDITDLEEGRDIVVTYKPAPADGKSFAETTIRPKPKQTVASTDKDILTKIKNHIDINSLYTEPSYAELEKAFKEWIDPTESSAIPTVESDDEDHETLSPTAEKALANVVKAKSTEDVTKDFEAMFNESEK